jgi:biotin-(acetyl-CoA carboxylase) ligase
MKLIKLGAIDSTNEFLKDCHKQELDNFTVVIAENKLKERGRWVPPGRLRR